MYQRSSGPSQQLSYKTDFGFHPESTAPNESIHPHDMCCFITVPSFESDPQNLVSDIFVDDADDVTIRYPLQSEHSHNEQALMHYAFLICQKNVGLEFSKDWPYMSSDLHEWWGSAKRYMGYEDALDPDLFEAEELAHENLDNEFFEKPNHLAAFLVGATARRYYEQRDEGIYSEQDYYAVKAEQSLLLNQILVQAFEDDPYPSGISQVLRQLLHSEKKAEFLSSLKDCMEAADFLPLAAELVLVREGDGIRLVNLSGEVVVENHVKIQEPDLGLRAIDGLDAAGKGAVLEKLGIFTFPAAHIHEAEAIKVARLIGGDKLVYEINEIAIVMTQLLEMGNIKQWQQKIVEVRHKIAAHMNPPFSKLYGVVSDRSLWTNLAYSSTAEDFIEKILLEFSKPTILPCLTYFIDTPLTICIQRIAKRHNTDIWDNSGVESIRKRQYLYYLLARTLPELIVRVDPTMDVRHDFAYMTVQSAAGAVAGRLRRHMGKG